MLQATIQALLIAGRALPHVVLAGALMFVCVLLCHGAGRLLVRGSAVTLTERLVLSVPIGMVVLGMSAFFLASAGGLSLFSFGLTVTVLHVAARHRWREDVVDVSSSLCAARRWATRAGRCPVMGWSLAVIGLLMTTTALWLLALYPRLGFDETLYHLPYTRAVLETGALPFLPHLRYPLFPILQELLWVPLLAMVGQSGPGLLVATQTAWVALLLAQWVGTRLGAGYGLVAACIWLGCPMIWWTGTQAMVDIGLALLLTTSAICVDRWEATRRSHWLALAGVAAGGGAATKYHGLLLIAAVVVVVVWGSSVQRRMRALVPLLVSAAIIVVPVYGWITATTGNPVFPFVADTFGASAWSQSTGGVRGSEVGTTSTVDTGTVFATRLTSALRDFDNLPRAITRLTVPGRSEKASAPFSWWLLPLAPVALLALRGPTATRPRRWAAMFAMYFLFWFASARDARYLFSALPWLIPLYATGLAALMAALVARWSSRRWSLLVLAVGLPLLLVPGLGYATHHLATLGALPTSAAAREGFLLARRPGYAALRQAEAHWDAHRPDERAPRMYVLYGADLQFFARAPLHGDWFGPHRFSRYAGLEAEAAIERLRADHFDYILEVTPSSQSLLRALPGVRPLYRDEQSTLVAITGDS